MSDTFPSQSEKSNTTDTTYPKTNVEFLKAIFEPLEEDIRPILVTLLGSPHTAHRSAWSGSAWNLRSLDLPPHYNNYFSLSTYKKDEKGSYRRKKAQFHALYAVMLDDIGSKIERERLTLPPSWLLETSPGNYQAGYILKEPITETGAADSLMKAIINAGLCDPGAGGPTARLARLPIAVNGKLDPEFPCRLEVWEPAQKYSTRDLIEGLSLDVKDTERPKRKAKTQPKDSFSEDEIFIPRPKENAIVEALKTRGLYKTPLGRGKHDITCPWVNEHTDSVDSGTAYFEPDDIFPLGGFKCLHGHCKHRHIRELLKELEIEISAARMKSKIRCVGGEIHRIVDKAEHELAQAKKYYQRGGLIVTITTDPSTRETCVKDIRQNALVAALSGAAEWERYDKRSEVWVRIDPPSRIVSVLYDVVDYCHLPALNGLTHQPFLRDDGTLTLQSGYDPSTGMFGVFKDGAFAIPEKPTKEDARAALNKISDLLSEFAFADKIDRSAALSAILCATLRPSLPLAPMYHVRAPQISSGKSFLCQIIGLFASPRKNSPTSFPQDDEECRKLLLSELLRAPAVIEFDNMTTDIIAHKSLCTVLTSEFLTGRILGVSKTATVGTRSLFLSSGNNVGPIHDMTRRCLTINLDPVCEHPATRTFKRPDLLTDLSKERHSYVSAALTIVRAWVLANRPKTECKSLASYTTWSELCRQPLLWLGLPDPASKIFLTMDEDPDRDLLGRLLHVWKDNFRNTPKMVRDAVNRAEETYQGEFYEVLMDIAGDRKGINRKILGHWIKRHARQIVDGMRFIPAGGSRSAAGWRVETIQSVPSVLSEF